MSANAAVENAGDGCLPCNNARKQAAARPRKSVMGDGKGYDPKDIAYMKAQDANAPQTYRRKGAP